MDAKVTEKGEMFFLGVKEVFPPGATFDAEGVMFKRFTPHAAAFKKHAIDKALYALVQNYEDGSSSYMVGMRVQEMAALPEDVPPDSVCTRVAPATYAEIPTTPRELGPEADGKVAAWIDEHPDYRKDPKTPDIEYYPPGCADADDAMTLWIPLLRNEPEV